jgi:hypothetical protein
MTPALRGAGSPHCWRRWASTAEQKKPSLFSEGLIQFLSALLEAKIALTLTLAIFIAFSAPS